MAKNKTTKEVIKPLYWNIPLSAFINQTERHTRKREDGTTYQETDKLETLQQIEEYIFSHFESFNDYIETDTDDIKQATEYIKGQVKKELAKQSKITLDDYADDIKDATRNAQSDAYDSNYQAEYMKELYQLIKKAIIKTAEEINDGDGHALLADKTGQMILPSGIVPDLWDMDTVKIPTTKEQIAKYNNTNSTIEDFGGDYQALADELVAYGELDNEINQVSDNQRENIDRYNSLGDTTGWIDIFKDSFYTNEVIDTIKKDIKADNNKINDKKYLHAEITSQTAKIRQTLAEYSTDKEYNGQLLRQIGSIEATTKKAI